MKCNVAPWDRVLRFLIGVLTVALAIGGGPFWLYIGVYFLLTAAWGLCPVYIFFKIRTLTIKANPRLKRHGKS